MKQHDQKDLIQLVAQKIGCVSKSISSIPGLLINGMELNCAQINILFCISKECTEGTTGKSIKDLAASLNMTSGAISHFVDGLFKAGIVERIEYSKDRRALRVQINNEVKKKFEACKEEYFSRISEIFSPLSAQDIASLAHIMDKIKPSESSKMSNSCVTSDIK